MAIAPLVGLATVSEEVELGVSVRLVELEAVRDGIEWDIVTEPMSERVSGLHRVVLTAENDVPLLVALVLVEFEPASTRFPQVIRVLFA